MSDQKHLSEVLRVAIEAAIEAGEYFRTKLDEVKQVKIKSSPSDLVTEVDPACERMIRARIHGRFPEHSILGEETTAPGAEASAAALAEVEAASHLWIVDPLDGTTNFVYSIPLSTVSIGYAESGVLKVGVVYDPYHGEVFFGLQGGGSYVASTKQMQEWLNASSADAEAAHRSQSNSQTASQSREVAWPGRQLSASKQTDIVASVVSTGFPTRASAREQAIAAGLRVCGTAKSFRNLGSAALHMAYVACGRIDVFWEYDLNAWDLAGGVLLIQEAGGTVHDLSGEPYRLATRDVVAAGHASLAGAIQEAIVGPAGA